MVRCSRLRPLGCGRQQCLLDGVLAGVELAVAPDQCAEDLRRELAQQVLGAADRFVHRLRRLWSPAQPSISGGASIDGRTSTTWEYFTIRPQMS